MTHLAEGLIEPEHSGAVSWSGEYSDMIGDGSADRGVAGGKEGVSGSRKNELPWFLSGDACSQQTRAKVQ
ncbi:MAG: hypothetical protein A2X67_03525 [Ignavibacteria bacterium GWA2_55_11]|nr:MAG: hypothetical protein A2X67_03525 [Ignavibacteria bacterium GWA2_55_11]OGU67117.1 MAG: hypothetical protein A3C56_00090 [Ignavibacteria bacterium RIFCSPHIGHO2_02_FULL_56_12]OGU74410.1 MAG: hypothetical protein A3G43_11300 [Ignavibacteria bacterium RIFCSPLOWO2_12_FULL_56_21]